MIDVVAAGVIDGKIVVDSRRARVRRAAAEREAGRCEGITTLGVAASMTTRRTFTIAGYNAYTADRVSRRIACLRLVAAAALAALSSTAVSAQAPTVLRWGGDAEGGAPSSKPTRPTRRACWLRRRNRRADRARAGPAARVRAGGLHLARSVRRARRFRHRTERHRRHPGPPRHAGRQPAVRIDSPSS